VVSTFKIISMLSVHLSAIRNLQKHLLWLWHNHSQLQWVPFWNTTLLERTLEGHIMKLYLPIFRHGIIVIFRYCKGRFGKMPLLWNYFRIDMLHVGLHLLLGPLMIGYVHRIYLIFYYM
jgi:hypothetical protein